MNPGIEDIRIQWTKVVLPPVFLEEERPVSDEAIATIFNARLAISRILAHRDQRLLVLVGPCSIHDTKAAVEYAGLLKDAIKEFSADLEIVMRVYFKSHAPPSAGRASSMTPTSTAPTKSMTVFVSRAISSLISPTWACPRAPSSST